MDTEVRRNFLRSSQRRCNLGNFKLVTNSHLLHILGRTDEMRNVTRVSFTNRAPCARTAKEIPVVIANGDVMHVAVRC